MVTYLLCFRSSITLTKYCLLLVFFLSSPTVLPTFPINACFSFYIICLPKMEDNEACGMFSFNNSFVLEAALNIPLCFSQILEIHKIEMAHVRWRICSVQGLCSITAVFYKPICGKIIFSNLIRDFPGFKGS